MKKLTQSVAIQMHEQNGLVNTLTVWGVEPIPLLMFARNERNFLESLELLAGSAIPASVALDERVHTRIYRGLPIRCVRDLRLSVEAAPSAVIEATIDEAHAGAAKILDGVRLLYEARARFFSSQSVAAYSSVLDQIAFTHYGKSLAVLGLDSPEAVRLGIKWRKTPAEFMNEATKVIGCGRIDCSQADAPLTRNDELAALYQVFEDACMPRLRRFTGLTESLWNSLRPDEVRALRRSFIDGFRHGAEGGTCTLRGDQGGMEGAPRHLLQGLPVALGEKILDDWWTQGIAAGIVTMPRSHALSAPGVF